MDEALSAKDQRVIKDVRAHGQAHIVRHLERLDAARRARLISQLAALDWERVDQLGNLISTPPTEISFGDTVPAGIERLPLTPNQRDAERRIEELGRSALAADRVAALVVAGGQGTRLRYDHPKGMFPISPLRNKGLFQLFAEQILAARRRHNCRMPWLIMTSPVNDAETRKFFADNGFFGLGEETVRFFIQGSNPILDERGRLLLAEEDELLTGPDGHGGTIEALARQGLLDMLRDGGWDLITYFQVDNPLVTVADARFIGHHLTKDADFSCKVVPKRDPKEGLGIAVIKSGRPRVIEYIDVPDVVAAERLPSGRLRFRYGSIAIHIIDVPFAEHVAHADSSLPWHVARKQYEVINEEGRKVQSAPKGCYKFERFIFDALAFAQACAFVEVRRETEFGPVKNADGEDSPESARLLMQRKWLEWLIEAGALGQMPREITRPVVEISPLYAADAEQLKERVKPGSTPMFPLDLEPSD